MIINRGAEEMDNGKRFEENYRDSAKSLYPSIDIDRINDNVGGYAGVAGFCDFVICSYPYTFYQELKSYKSHRINFNVLTDNQYQGLLRKSAVKGAMAGAILNFSEYEQAYYLDIRQIKDMREQGIKSLAVEEAPELGVLLPGHRLRTNFTYDVQSLLHAIELKYESGGESWDKK